MRARNASFLLLMLFCNLYSPMAAGLDESGIPPIPAFDAVLTSALSQSLEAKRASLLHDQAIVARDLLRYDRFPRVGASVKLADQRPETTPAGPHQSLGLHLTYDLYDFGRNEAQQQQAELEARVRAVNIDELNEALTWHIARAYLALMAASGLLSISNENLALAQTRLANARKGYNQGLRPENDVVAAEADFGETKLAYEKAEVDLLIEIRQVELFSGQSSPLPVSPHPKIVKSLEEWDRLVKSWDTLAPSAADARRVAQRQSLDASEQIVLTTRYPSLGLEVGAEKRDIGTAGGPIFSGQIELTWNLPWSGQIRDKQEQIHLQRNVIDVEDALERKARSDEVVLASERFAATKRLVRTAEGQFQLRHRQYQLVKARYEAGKATVLELSSVELQLGQERLEKERLGNQLAQAVLELANAKRIKNPGTIFAGAKALGDK